MWDIIPKDNIKLMVSEQGYNICIGDGSIINHNATILDDAKGESASFDDCIMTHWQPQAVTIGCGSLLATDVKIYTLTHASNPDERLQDNQANSEYRYPVTIGNNCWIGGGAIILPGVTIGNDVTVAAGAVVNKDVESRCLVAGVPARVVKRFPKAEWSRVLGRSSTQSDCLWM
jgi:maltose O-acetyltransferase